jgi:hypothetical protein
MGTGKGGWRESRSPTIYSLAESGRQTVTKVLDTELDSTSR